MYGGRILIKTTYHDIVRTFCSCPSGMVAIETYDGYICVNGHSNSNHDSENSNFAFLCEINLTSPVENSVIYAKAIAEVASTIGGGKPLLQTLDDLRCGRRSTWSRYRETSRYFYHFFFRCYGLLRSVAKRQCLCRQV